MLYIDFDGVILDTEELLFEDWRKIKDRHLLPETEKIKYIKNRNWDYILNNSPIINDSIYYLNNMNPNETFILTKVHSLENEASAKIRWLRNQKVKQTIIPVPHDIKKSDVVDPYNNILVDDSLFNLEEWEELGGIPILFDINNDNYDSWNKPNIKEYKKVLDLSSFKK